MKIHYQGICMRLDLINNLNVSIILKLAPKMNFWGVFAITVVDFTGHVLQILKEECINWMEFDFFLCAYCFQMDAI